jgi:type III pantothenate kinase
MSRVLAVTLGNTTASVSLTDADGRLGEVLRVPIGRLENLKEALPGADADLSEEGVSVVVASVNPRALARFRGIAVDVTGSEPDVAGADFPIPIRAEVDAPESVGVDRLLAALAAFRRARGACIVVDAGTAVTVDAVSADGAFQGGAIFPGMDMMAQALAEKTALLPRVIPHWVETTIGKNTEEAILAGVAHAWQGGILYLMAGALAAVGEEAKVFLTGGEIGHGATEVKNFLDSQAPAVGKEASAERSIIVPNLVLEGLVIAYREWQQR